MRSRRLSFVAGWAAVGLLALVGFAAFGADDLSPEELQAKAAENAIGHTAGAYAGLSFALIGDDGSASVLSAVVAEEEAPATESNVEDPASTSGSTGTNGPTNTGWLSELEVRALVSAYFEPTDVNRAVRVAWCESRFDPNHVDLRTGGVGLFNHLPRYWDERASNAGFPGVAATDPEASTAAAAWEVYNGGGWDVFNCR